MGNEAPVLLITFNRPDTTMKVFEKIREYQPAQLFIFSDGPRPLVAGEDILVNECRVLFDEQNIDWNCTVTRWYNDDNMGCARGVSSAITRAFKLVEKLIILEDDVVPHLSFFSFCNTMLNKYARNEQVMHISGTRWNEEYNMGSADHFFSTIGHIWGWATWKRAWNKYDFNLSRLPEFKKDRALLKRFNDAKISRYWYERFEEVYAPSDKRTWDYQWQFALFLNEGLAVVPNVNLVSNIGIVGDHSDGETSKFHFCKVYQWTETTKGALPATINPGYEKHHIKTRFMEKPPVFVRINNRLKQLFKAT